MEILKLFSVFCFHAGKCICGISAILTRLESFNALKDKTIDDLNFQIKKLNDQNKMLNEFVQSQMKILKELDERFHKCKEIMIQLSSRKGDTNQSDTKTQRK